MALAHRAKFVEVDPCKTLSFLQKIQALASKIYAIRTACVSCQFVYIIYNCNSQSLFRLFSGDVFFPATWKFHQCQRCKARVSLKKLTKFLAVTLYLGIVVCVGHHCSELTDPICCCTRLSNALVNCAPCQARSLIAKCYTQNIALKLILFHVPLKHFSKVLHW